MGPTGHLCSMELSQYSVAAKLWALIDTAKIGPRAIARLLIEFGSVDGIYLAQVGRLAPSIDAGGAFLGLDAAELLMEKLEALDIRITTVFDMSYPEGFRELNDPPPLIFHRGALPIEGQRVVGVAGSRATREPGIADAVLFGRLMARDGVKIVTGLCGGVNSSTVVGALSENGVAYAVTAGGLAGENPPDLGALARQIVTTGALIGEYPLTIPAGMKLIEAEASANRLLVSLPQAVVIAELSDDSVGARDVAKCCHELGKTLFLLIPERGLTLSESTLGELTECGAIPISFPSEVNTIIKCLG